MLGYDLGSTYWNQGETKISVKTAPSLDKAWEFDTTAGVTATPVINAGKVYVQSGAIIAIKTQSGSELWRNSDIGGFASMAFSDGVLYVHDSPSVVHALKAEDGTEIWQLKTTDIAGAVGFSSPIVTKDYVLVGGSTLEEVAPAPAGGLPFRGFVDAINKKDGTLAWQKFTVEGDERGCTLWSTVAVDEALGTVYAATGNNHGPPAGPTSDAFLAIPLATGGDYLWSQQILTGDVFTMGVSSPDSDFGANPIVFDYNGKKLIAGGNKGGDFWVLNRETGEVLKKVNLGPGSSFKGGFFVSGAWDGKRLLAACNGATSTEPGSETGGAPAVLYALDPETLDTVWARQVAGPVFGPISVANGVGLFGKSMTLQAFNTETGEVLKEFATEATIATAPAVSNGYVVFGSGMSWIGATNGTKYYALKVP
jgi:outer membrane protein assembly factor BamB